MYSQIVQITLPALRNIGYKLETYIIFGVFNFVNACIMWAFYPETTGLTLESVDDLFRRDDEPAGSRKFGWQSSTVEKAPANVHEGEEGPCRRRRGCNTVGYGAGKRIYGRGRGEGSMSLHKYIHSRDGYEYLLRRKKAMLSA